MKHKLPKLKYEYDALEPHIDAKTMEIHHSKHHQAYVDNLNKALFNSGIADLEIEYILKNLYNIPEKIRTAVVNNGGGHANHSFFWTVIGPKNNEPFGEILEAINKKFGSFEEFKEEFSKAALTKFGSGWAWLVLNRGELEIISTTNQNTPISKGKTPVLCIDVWEHAYYLKYQNLRAKYIEAFFNVINWEQVNKNYVKNRLKILKGDEK